MTRWTATAVVMLALVSGAAWGADARVDWMVIGDGYVPVIMAPSGVPGPSPRAGATYPTMPHLQPGLMAGCPHFAAEPWVALGDGYVPGSTTLAGEPTMDTCDAGCAERCHGDLAYAPRTGPRPAVH